MSKNTPPSIEAYKRPLLGATALLALGALAAGCTTGRGELVSPTSKCVGISPAGDLLRPADWPLGRVLVDANIVAPGGGEEAYSATITHTGNPAKYTLNVPAILGDALGQLKEFGTTSNGEWVDLGIRTPAGEFGLTEGCTLPGSDTQAKLPTS